MSASNIGALEICSDRPLLVATRIFNQDDNGTYGQSYDGRVADLGYSAGQTISLIGLRRRLVMLPRGVCRRTHARL